MGYSGWKWRLQAIVAAHACLAGRQASLTEGGNMPRNKDVTIEVDGKLLKVGSSCCVETEGYIDQIWPGNQEVWFKSYDGRYQFAVPVSALRRFPEPSDLSK